MIEQANILATCLAYAKKQVDTLRKEVMTAVAKIEGRPGKDGKDGKDGARGADGSDGTNGIDGVDGSPGAPAEKGDTGENGKDGKDGKDGRDGKDGAKGDKGDPGSDGRDGVDGHDGVDGTNGNDGLAGRDGRDGSDGRDGKDGQDGKDGRDGKDGLDGKEGKQGPKGDQGDPGKDGAPGKDGLDGRDGKDGLDGKDGKDADITPIEKKFTQLEQRVQAKLTQAVMAGGGGGGSVNLLDNDDVEYKRLQDMMENGVLIFDQAKHKFVAKSLVEFINTIKDQILTGEMMYTKLIDTVGTMTYIGESTPGSSTGGSVWRIYRVDSTNDPDMEIKWAEASTMFDKVWDNRISYTYS